MTRVEFMNLIPIGPATTRDVGRMYGLKGGVHEAQFKKAVPGETVSFILVNSDGWGMMAEAMIVEKRGRVLPL